VLISAIVQGDCILGIGSFVEVPNWTPGIYLIPITAQNTNAQNSCEVVKSTKEKPRTV
jgi:hypothetical protein